MYALELHLRTIKSGLSRKTGRKNDTHRLPQPAARNSALGHLLEVFER
jgi:hypothetical protein